ncbi:MAG: RteC domain-containing protein [Bacteroidetes bacterium]|nr:RteC domain-containing protein [Bacteroidota bacterium]
MRKFVQDLESELTGTLNAISSGTNRLSVAYKSRKAVTEFIHRLQEYIRVNPFTDESAEIEYFKRLAPPFYSRLFYFSKICQIELDREFAAVDRIEQTLIHELDIVEKFFERHREFCIYYYQKVGDADDRLFVRNKRENEMVDEVEIIMNSDFCVGCYWAARFLANNTLKKYLTEELELLRNPPSRTTTEAPVLIWTGSKTDLIELIYGFYFKKSFNGGEASIDAIAAWFQTHLNIDLGNFYITRQEILRRKNLTQYIDELRDASRSNAN